MTATSTSVTSLVTAPNLTIQAANGISYAYRRFGPASTLPPVIFLQHFRGNIDNWDYLLVDTIARQREVILVDNTGVGLTGGTTPSTVAQMTTDLLAFIDALELKRIDVLGFSLGGFIAQELALVRPQLVNRLVLAGTGPQGAAGMHGWRRDIADRTRADNAGIEDILYVFYAHTATSQAVGGQVIARLFSRADGRDSDVSFAARDAQYDAIVTWGIPNHTALQRLTGITAPTLILQGDSDLMLVPRQSHLMAGLIPDARLVIYPDASHGSIFQYADSAAREVLTFLSE